jgi:5-oxoprolinase (ATP-hydrolysing)
MTNSRLTDPEVLEWRFPVRIQEFSIRRGSGGRGLHRGGDGVVRQTQFLEPMTVTMLTGHRDVAPYGLAGGGDAACGVNTLIRASGERVRLKGVDGVEVNAGDAVRLETPGGGAFGRAAAE